MKIFYVILWLVSVFFLSPGALYQKRTELPRMVMEAADSVVEPGMEWDWEAEQMQADPLLELSGRCAGWCGQKCRKKWRRRAEYQ